MKLHGELAISFFQLFRAGAALHAENFVIVAFGRHQRDFLSEAEPGAAGWRRPAGRLVGLRLLLVVLHFLEVGIDDAVILGTRSEEHTSELQSLMSSSIAF